MGEKFTIDKYKNIYYIIQKELSKYIEIESNSNKKKKKGTKRNLKGGIIHFIPETVINIDWIPYRIANYGGYVGLYSQTEFTIDNWQDTEMLYVDEGTGEYNIPLFLQEYTSLYVLYITNSEYSST